MTENSNFVKYKDISQGVFIGLIVALVFSVIDFFSIGIKILFDSITSYFIVSIMTILVIFSLLIFAAYFLLRGLNFKIHKIKKFYFFSIAWFFIFIIMLFIILTALSLNIN